MASPEIKETAAARLASLKKHLEEAQRQYNEVGKQVTKSNDPTTLLRLAKHAGELKKLIAELETETRINNFTVIK